VRGLERVERSEPAAREERDSPSQAAPDAHAKHLACAQQVGRAHGLEAEQLAQLLARPVESRVAEAATILGGQVHAAELEIARHVLEEVHELESRADGVARRNGLRVVESAEHAEDEPAAGVGRVHAVVLHLVPRLVLAHPLVHPVRVDQPQERLPRQAELGDRRLDVPQHRPRRLTGKGGVDLPLELVERGETVTVVCVAQLVHEPRVAVEGPDVRAQRAREENGADREVLTGGAGGDLRELHRRPFLLECRAIEAPHDAARVPPVPMAPEPLLPPESLARYADAIVKASLCIKSGDTLVVHGEPEHRELLVAVAESAYRAGARFVDTVTADPLVMRARLLYGSDEAIGALSPWTRRRLQAVAGADGALAAIHGEGAAGYLDGIPPERLAADYSGIAKQTAFLRRAQLNMRARWTIAGWPTDHWAGQVYPKLPALKAKRRLAADLLDFCRLADGDGKGATGWLKHLRTLGRRSAKLSKLGLARLELRGPGTELDVGFVSGTRWIGGTEALEDGTEFAPNMPTEEVYTSPDARRTSGTFRCTFPLSFRGRLIEGLRGEFAGGRLVRLEADSDADRDFVAAYIDTDKNGRRLGEVALVDSSSRIGQAGRVYYNTLLDENAATHIAFGSGFGGTRVEKPARGVNRSAMHLDVMIGSPDLQVTGINASGRRIPLITDGAWQI